MTKTITFFDFCDAFSDTYKNNFSYEGKRALFDYLESVEEDTGEVIELDIVAFCCEYTQYDDLEALRQDYPDVATMEELQEETTVIPIGDTDSFIIQQF